MNIDDFPQFEFGESIRGTRIEIRRSPSRGQVRHVLFDFDGTLSLVRSGWRDIMVAMMVEILSEYMREGETQRSLAAQVYDYVDRLTGKQTIYQMSQLVEEIKKRGGTPLQPLQYKHAYYDKLAQRIGSRIAGLSAGVIAPEDMMMPRARALLEDLSRRNVRLYLASGTDLTYVRQEAELLGIDQYFDGGIYGALDRVEDFSKAAVINQILEDHGVQGPQLVSFGDGYVEILNTRKVGGTAVGVASDEVGRREINQWKRNRLIQAGADLITPGYEESDLLLAYLFGEEDG